MDSGYVQDVEWPLEWDKENKWDDKKWWNKKLRDQFNKEERQHLIGQICHHVLVLRQAEYSSQTIRKEISGIIWNFHVSESNFTEQRKNYYEIRKTQENDNNHFRSEITKSEVNFSSFFPTKQKNPHDLSFPFEKTNPTAPPKSFSSLDIYLREKAYERAVRANCGAKISELSGKILLYGLSVVGLDEIAAKFTRFVVKKVSSFAEYAFTAAGAEEFFKKIISTKESALSNEMMRLGVDETTANQYAHDSLIMALSAVPLNVGAFTLLTKTFSSVRKAGVVAQKVIKDDLGKIRLNYSKNYRNDFSKFIDPSKHKGKLKEEMHIVKYFDPNDPKSSHKWWVPVSEANYIHTVEEFMDKAALLKEWGKRTHVAKATIPIGERAKFCIGKAAAQTMGIEKTKGGITQVRFKTFDPHWIKEVRALPKEEKISKGFKQKFNDFKQDELGGGNSGWPRGTPSQFVQRKEFVKVAKEELKLLKELPEIKQLPQGFPATGSDFWSKGKIVKQESLIYHKHDNNLLYFLESHQKRILKHNPNEKVLRSMLKHAEKHKQKRLFLVWDPTVQSPTETLRNLSIELVGTKKLSRGEGINPLWVVEIKPKGY